MMLCRGGQFRAVVVIEGRCVNYAEAVLRASSPKPAGAAMAQKRAANGHSKPGPDIASWTLEEKCHKCGSGCCQVGACTLIG